jgi:hypothetical protein
MKAYIVIRTILFKRKGMVTMPIQAFDDRDGADDMVKKLSEAIACQMDCQMIHPRDKGVKVISGDTFLGDLGIKLVEHSVIEMPVKQSSLIKIPNLELIKK